MLKVAMRCKSSSWQILHTNLTAFPTFLVTQQQNHICSGVDESQERHYHEVKGSPEQQVCMDHINDTKSSPIVDLQDYRGCGYSKDRVASEVVVVHEHESAAYSEVVYSAPHHRVQHRVHVLILQTSPEPSEIK